MSEHPNAVATAYARQQDEFTEIRKRLNDHIDRNGCNSWIDRWLTIKAVEELIDAKIAAIVDRAILQERERCAQIAETPRCNTCGTAREPNSDDCCPWPDLECANRHDIAAAIRSKP